MLRPLPNHMILRLPNDDDGCMNPHNAPGCYVQQLHAFRLSQHIPMLNLIKKNRIIMFVLIILNGAIQVLRNAMFLEIGPPPTPS